MSGNPKFLPSVQILRAVAVLLVVACHMSIIRSVPTMFWIGEVGVDLFFVVSGFIIAWTYDGEGSSWHYLRARLARVYPTYWAVLALSLAYYGLRRERAWPTPEYLARGVDWWAIARSVVLYDQQYTVKVVDVAWTLTYELLFYAFYTLRFFLPGWMFALVSAAWAGVIGAGYHWEWPVTVRHPVLFNVKLVEFHAGVLVAWLARRLPPTRTSAWYVAATVLCTFVASLMVRYILGPLDLVRNLMVPFALWVLTGALHDRDGATRYPRFLLAIGASSYSLYLTHALVIDFFDGFHGERAALLIGLQLVVGYLFYLAVERPLVRLLVPRRASSPHWRSPVDPTST